MGLILILNDCVRSKNPRSIRHSKATTKYLPFCRNYSTYQSTVQVVTNHVCKFIRYTPIYFLSQSRLSSIETANNTYKNNSSSVAKKQIHITQYKHTSYVVMTAASDVTNGPLERYRIDLYVFISILSIFTGRPHNYVT